MKDTKDTTEPKASAAPEPVKLEVGKTYTHTPSGATGELERIDGAGNPYLAGLAGPVDPLSLSPLS